MWIFSKFVKFLINFFVDKLNQKNVKEIINKLPLDSLVSPTLKRENDNNLLKFCNKINDFKIVKILRIMKSHRNVFHKIFLF